MRRYAPYRRAAAWVQALVLLGLPFIRIRGESAFRFDIPSLRLHLFGTTVWMQEFFLVLLALLLVLFLIGLFTVLLGRVWCGWVCPQTVLSDLTAQIISSRTLLKRSASHAWTFLVSLVVGASLIWYFVSPYEFFHRLFENRLGPVLWGFWTVHTVILYLDLAFLRQRFCKTVCPYAKMQSVLYDDRTLVIAFDERRKDECMNCQACFRACPVGIDIRDGQDAACISCTKCIDACSRQTARVGKVTLIDYFFGLPGTASRLLRANVFLLGTVSLVLLVLLVHLAQVRAPFEMFARRDVRSPVTSQDGPAAFPYRVNLRNLGQTALEITLSVEGGTLGSLPSVSLAPSESREITLEVRPVPDRSRVVLTATASPGDRSVSIPLKTSQTGLRK